MRLAKKTDRSVKEIMQLAFNEFYKKRKKS